MAYMCVRGSKECDGCGRCNGNMDKCFVCGKETIDTYEYNDNIYCENCYYEQFQPDVDKFDDKLVSLGEKFKNLVRELEQIYSESLDCDNPELDDTINDCEKALKCIKSGLNYIY